MLEFYIKSQAMSFYSPVIAADSLNSLSARFHFSGSDWEGLSKWAHFRCGDRVYDLALDENDAIRADMGLNLTAGIWQVYLSGSDDSRRMTTVPVLLTVKESGLIDAPLHEMPLSVAEQIAARADTALSLARELQAAADRGDFTGQSFQVLGFFTSLTELEKAVPSPDKSSVYGVGSAPPYDIYIWDSLKNRWHNNGPIQGAKGEDGAAGTCFIPSVDSSGNLSWSNDGGLPVPESVNLMGPRGEKGEPGADGLSPYEAALAEGFTGTASTFNSALAILPQHASRHAAGAVDPLPEGSISGEMLKKNAVSRDLLLTLPASWQGSAAPYSLSVSASGVSTGDSLILDLVPDSDPSTAESQQEAWAQIYKAESGSGQLSFLALEKPELSLTVKAKAVRF